MSLKKLYRVDEMSIDLGPDDQKRLAKMLQSAGPDDKEWASGFQKKIGGGSPGATKPPVSTRAKGTPPPPPLGAKRARGASVDDDDDPFARFELGPYSTVRPPATSLPKHLGGTGPGPDDAKERLPGAPGKSRKEPGEIEWDPRSGGIQNMLPHPKSANVDMGDAGSGDEETLSSKWFGTGKGSISGGGSSWDPGSKGFDQESMPRAGGGWGAMKRSPGSGPELGPSKGDPFMPKKAKLMGGSSLPSDRKKFDIDDYTPQDDSKRKPGLLSRIFGGGKRKG